MCSNRIQRVFRATLLGVLGYALYFGGTLLASFADSSISTSDSSWEVGSIAAFGLAASELFVLDSWALKKSLLRRLILSISIAIVSILIAGSMCMMIGIEQGRGALIWPKISMALLVFAFLTLYCRRVLLICFNGNDPPNECGTKQISLVVTNRHAEPIIFYLEPWGDEHEMSPGATFRIDFYAPNIGAIPVSYEQGSITVEGWEGSFAEIWHEGQQLN